MTREEKLNLYSLDDTMGAGGIINRKIPREEWALIGQMIEGLRQRHKATQNQNKKTPALA